MREYRRGLHLNMQVRPPTPTPTLSHSHILTPSKEQIGILNDTSDSSEDDVSVESSSFDIDPMDSSDNDSIDQRLH